MFHNHKSFTDSLVAWTNNLLHKRKNSHPNPARQCLRSQGRAAQCRKRSKLLSSGSPPYPPPDPLLWLGHGELWAGSPAPRPRRALRLFLSWSTERGRHPTPTARRPTCGILSDFIFSPPFCSVGGILPSILFSPLFGGLGLDAAEDVGSAAGRKI